MEEFSKNIEGIRRMMSDLRNEKYAIVNPDLVSLDEYMKTLYLKVLCTVVQLGDEPTEMQILFLKRIVSGIGVDDPAEEYMRRGLEISDIDMQEFLAGMKENRAKYYFALDGLILVSIGTENQECYLYLAEIIELLDICKDDLKYICLVASSVLQQQSSLYDEAKKLTNERVQEIDYAPYLQNFYCGAIQDSRELVHFSAPDRKNSDAIEFRSSYTERIVIFDNLNIAITENWRFDGCEEVRFTNCNITGRDFSIAMQGCKKVVIEACRFDGFHVPVLEENWNIEVMIENCDFENCVYQYNRATCDWMALGGVIHTDNSEKNAVNFIRGTKFKKCGGRNSCNYYSSAIISNCRCKVYDCEFNDCWNYNNGNNKDPEQRERCLFLNSTEGEGIEIINSANFF